jgi:hypothetical protein
MDPMFVSDSPIALPVLIVQLPQPTKRMGAFISSTTTLFVFGAAHATTISVFASPLTMRRGRPERDLLQNMRRAQAAAVVLVPFARGTNRSALGKGGVVLSSPMIHHPPLRTRREKGDLEVNLTEGH